MANEVFTSIEEGLFNLETQSGKPEIFLKPKEKVTVPFKYLTFKADHSVNQQVRKLQCFTAIHSKLPFYQLTGKKVTLSYKYGK